jgi:hypothetical protein
MNTKVHQFESKNHFQQFFYDFLLPDQRLNPIEFDLVRTFSSPVFEHAQTQRGERASRTVFCGELDDFRAGVVFLFHG